jgi:uncharacterized membrane protein YeaQ/YmgE (transglycosylase-associated protein family)
LSAPDQAEIMTVDVGAVLAWAFIGTLTGGAGTQHLASRGFGSGGDAVIGIVGGIVGGFLMSLLGVQGTLGLLAGFLAAFVGAVLLTARARAWRRPSPR